MLGLFPEGSSYFKRYLSTVLEGYQPVWGSSTVSVFGFVVGGTGFEGPGLCKWRSGPHGCQCNPLPDVGNVGSRVAVHRDHRCLSNEEVS